MTTTLLTDEREKVQYLAVANGYGRMCSVLSGPLSVRYGLTAGLLYGLRDNVLAAANSIDLPRKKEPDTKCQRGQPVPGWPLLCLSCLPVCLDGDMD